MKIVICIDEDLGYSFNKRRQSRDKKMREHMLGVLRGEGAGLFVNAYSAKSLQSDGLPTDEVTAVDGAGVGEDEFLETADKENGWAFVENTDITGYLDRIDEMIVYHWNRLYLSDLKLPASFLKGFRTVVKEQFSGTSHDSMHYTRMVRIRRRTGRKNRNVRGGGNGEQT
ncbi:MAG: hypothetical protein II672_04710 [Oscillospiraceae bacterium]|nr:hypothetical protein [Oscillospiraceae bacterium]